MQRSKVLLGSVVTVAVLGLGAVAVAAEGDTGGDGSLEGTTTTVDSTTTTAAPTTTVVPVPDTGTSIDDPTGELTDDEGAGDVERSTEGCGGGTYANHGDYVSSVAHDPDREPGDVGDAAHSDCGKPLSAVGGDDEVPAPEVPGTGIPTGNGNAGGNGNGNAGGNGNGNGNAGGKAGK
jgi:hypothetical protein